MGQTRSESTPYPLFEHPRIESHRGGVEGIFKK